MAKKRTDEELHRIYLKCAELMATEGEKAVLHYLETEENYRSPAATWFYFLKNEDYKKAEAEYKEQKREARKQPEPEKVTMNGIEYTKMVPGEIPERVEPIALDKPMDGINEELTIKDEMSQVGDPERASELELIQTPEEKMPEEPDEEKTETAEEMTSGKIKPIGLMPRKAWLEVRVTDIMQAMWRYIEAREQIPVTWWMELNQLITFLQREEEYKG